jgi:hypothetical protein
MAQEEHDDLEVGFATFFLNRTNRSGILNGGIIGGRDQVGRGRSTRATMLSNSSTVSRALQL